MGISFKVSKTGKRFQTKLVESQHDSASLGSSSRTPIDISMHIPGALQGRPGSRSEVDAIGEEKGVCVVRTSSEFSKAFLPEIEASFTLYIFQKGYFIGKPDMIENPQSLLQDIKLLHPYDKASETLFSAIESGCLPGDILDDIPSKYYRGTIVCEIRDYRKCVYDQGNSGALVDTAPTINRVQLRMSLENVVRDIHSISDDTWTYRDIMEVEARIVKALQPDLYLDPTPRLEKLCDDSHSSKLNLGLGRRKRLRQGPEVIVTSTNQSQGKKVFIDVLPENSNFKAGDSAVIAGDTPLHPAHAPAHDNMNVMQLSGLAPSVRLDNFSQGATRPASLQSKVMPTMSNSVLLDRRSAANFIRADVDLALPQNMISSYSEASHPDGQITHIQQGVKRQKQSPMGGIDDFQAHQVGSSQIPGLNGMDLQWKNPILHQQQVDAKGVQLPSSLGNQRYLPSQVVNNISNQDQSGSFYFTQTGLRHGPKEEQIEVKLERQENEKSKDPLQALMAEGNTLDPQQQFRTQQQQQLRGHLPSVTQWNNARTLVEKDIRKDDIVQKKKATNSSHVASRPMVQSPVSSKSGEISSGSVGGQFSAVANSAFGSQKVAPNSNAALGAPSVTSSPNDSMQRQHHTSVGPKRKANSITKTQTMSGVGSPASVVSNMNAPLNACSPSIGTAPAGDQTILEHFSKIEMLTMRFQLNAKKKTHDGISSRKPESYSTQELSHCLGNSFSGEDFIDQVKPLSKSVIVSGNPSTTCLARSLNFVRSDHVFQAVSMYSHNRVAMTEKPYDGTITMHYGDSDDSDTSKIHDCVYILPTANYADLLAAQLSTLMDRDGYQQIEDQTRVIPLRSTFPSGGANVAMVLSTEGIASDSRNPEIVPGQQASVVPPASQNISSGGRMMVSGGNMPSSNFGPGNPMTPKLQQLDPSLLQQQQQQLLLQQNQQAQIQQQNQLQIPLQQVQRGSPLMSASPLSQLMGQNVNISMNPNHMVNKASQMQFQMLQQQVQQNQLTRKVMMGLNGAVGMGNLSSNMMGLGGLSNVMGIGGVRGMSSPIGMSGLGNMTPSQMNLGMAASNFGASATRPGAMAAMAKLRMNSQSRTGVYGPQAGLANIPASSSSSNPMLPGSAGLPVLGHALNRGNMSPLHRNPMAAMGPPKMSGSNFYFNQQFQQLQQQQQLIQQQQQQTLQPQAAQQQISSPLQPVQAGSPQLVGSPAIGLPQQQISPQQMAGQAAMSPQLSSGTLQQMNNLSPAPASPQLSSQTHGSVGRIASSPMEQLQGGNNGSMGTMG